MIKIRGSRIYFTGKDNKWVRKWAKKYRMSIQHFITGTLWVSIMTTKRAELKAKEGF